MTPAGEGLRLVLPWGRTLGDEPRPYFSLPKVELLVAFEDGQYWLIGGPVETLKGHPTEEAAMEAGRLYVESLLRPLFAVDGPSDS